MNKRSSLSSIFSCLMTGSISAIVMYILLVVVTIEVNATAYTATVTGYAFAYIGADTGHVLTQYDFANHQPGQICNGTIDQTGYWPWGTGIRMNNPVTMRNQQNQAFTRQWFYLHDNGDPNCDGGPAWVDLHFGRWKDMYQYSCSCGLNNVPNPVCDPGFNSVNNCYDAIYFGSATRGYTR